MLLSIFILVACVGIILGGTFGLFTRYHGIQFIEGTMVGLGGALFAGSLGYLTSSPSMTVGLALASAAVGAILFLAAIWAGANFLQRQGTEV
jgi:hypothetical protein